MLSSGQIYAANQWASLVALAEKHDERDFLYEAYSDLKSEKASEEAAEAISESSWQVKDFFEFNDSARDEFYEYMQTGENETEAYDESTTLLDKLEYELLRELGLSRDDAWPAELDGTPTGRDV